MIGIQPLDTGPICTLPGIGREQRLLKSGRVLKPRTAVAVRAALQPPIQKVQGSAEKPKGPYQPPQDDEEPEPFRTVTIGNTHPRSVTDDQSSPLPRNWKVSPWRKESLMAVKAMKKTMKTTSTKMTTVW